MQCATAVVPLDYRNLRAGTITLGLSRKPAADPTRRIGSLFVNPGGPGGDTHGFTGFMATALPAEVTARFDIVGFDPRGVGRSSALKCQDDRTYADSWDGVTARPTATSVDRAVKLGRAFKDDCRQRLSGLLPFVGTEYVARDMDVLRAAVGDPKLSYFGLSFGTYIGTVYANLFPGNTRVLALDGAYNPEHYANDPYSYDTPQYLAVDGALKRFFDWCVKNTASCAFGNGNPERAFLDLQSALDANPLRDAAGNLIANGATMSLQVAFNLGGGKLRWPRLSTRLIEAQNRTGVLVGDVAGESEFLNPNVAIECADRKFPTDTDLMRRVVQAETKLAPLLGPAIGFGPPNYDHGHATACVQWPIPQLSRYGGPFNARGSAPILVVGSTGDPDTPFEDSQALVDILDNAQLLTFRGEGHTGFSNSLACVKTAIGDYLLTGVLPTVRECADDRG